MDRDNKRSMITELLKWVMTTTEIVRTTGYKKMTVYDGVKHYQELGSTSKRPGSGRRITATANCSSRRFEVMVG